jgi:hypothetical protein
MLHQAKMICSSIDVFNLEVDTLRKMFLQNGYTRKFFDQIVLRFSQSLAARSFNSSQNTNNISTDENTALNNNDTLDQAFLSIPYYGRCSIEFGKSMSKIIFNNFNINLKVAYTTVKIGNLFHLKSRTPHPLSMNVVYRFSCAANAQVTYIGYTSRHLTTRVEEHTDLTLKSSSHVHKHIKQCSACKNVENKLKSFQIIKHCRDEFECRVAEAFAIKQEKPAINKQMTSHGASVFLNVFN